MNTNMNGNADPAAKAGEMVVVDIRHMTESQLAQLGVSQLAYVKPVIVEGHAAYAIHAADGTPMAVTDDRDVAVAAIQQHEMVPASVH